MIYSEAVCKGSLFYFRSLCRGSLCVDKQHKRGNAEKTDETDSRGLFLETLMKRIKRINTNFLISAWCGSAWFGVKQLKRDGTQIPQILTDSRRFLFSSWFVVPVFFV